MTPVDIISRTMRPHTVRVMIIVLSAGYLLSAPPSMFSTLQVNTSPSTYGTELDSLSRLTGEVKTWSVDRCLESDSQVMVGSGLPSTSHFSLRVVLPELGSTTERLRI